MRLHALLLICIFSLFLLALPSFAKEEIAIIPSGKTALNVASKKRMATVTIRTLKIENDCSGEIQANLSQKCKPVMVIQKLDISVDGQQIFVPRSVFADLINPRWVSIELKNAVNVLFIDGGDGADSYFVHVYFDGQKIIRRALYSSLVPDKAVEETRYWLRVLKDE